MPILETILIGKCIAAIFGKAAVGAVVKTAAVTATKAWLVHDAVQVVGHIADAVNAADAVNTTASFSDIASTVPDTSIPDCGGTEISGGVVIASTPILIDTTGVIIDPAEPIADCGGIGIPIQFAGDDSVIALGDNGVDADIDIHGNNPKNDIHGNPPHDIHGNNPKNNGHGNGPGNIHGPWFK